MPSGGARRRAKLRAGGVRAAKSAARGNRAARRARATAEARDKGKPRGGAPLRRNVPPRAVSSPARPAAPAHAPERGAHAPEGRAHAPAPSVAARADRSAPPAAIPRSASAARSERSARIPIEGPIRILFLDVDGTMTDGIIGFDAQGDVRNFWVRDGLALEWAKGLGVLPVVISGRASLAVELRMKDLGLEHYLGIKDKVEVAERVLAREGVDWKQCVMVGDDLPDVPMLKRAGWAVAVADSSPEVLAVSAYVTRLQAGRGAVREVIERVLRHNGVWEEILRRYEVTP